MTLEERGYGLGQRNPQTFPDGTKSSEGPIENLDRTRYWNSLARKIRNGSLIGAKYI